LKGGVEPRALQGASRSEPSRFWIGSHEDYNNVESRVEEDDYRQGRQNLAKAWQLDEITIRCLNESMIRWLNESMIR
jgi:hypothetical protein